MSDDPPVNVLHIIADAWTDAGEYFDVAAGRSMLFRDALLAAGYDIVPADTARLGQAVQETPVNPEGNGPPSMKSGWAQAIRSIYARAGVERP